MPSLVSATASQSAPFRPIGSRPELAAPALFDKSSLVWPTPAPSLRLVATSLASSSYDRTHQHVACRHPNSQQYATEPISAIRHPHDITGQGATFQAPSTPRYNSNRDRRPPPSHATTVRVYSVRHDVSSRPTPPPTIPPDSVRPDEPSRRLVMPTRNTATIRLLPRRDESSRFAPTSPAAACHVHLRPRRPDSPHLASLNRTLPRHDCSPRLALTSLARRQPHRHWLTIPEHALSRLPITQRRGSARRTNPNPDQSDFACPDGPSLHNTT